MIVRAVSRERQMPFNWDPCIVLGVAAQQAAKFFNRDGLLGEIPTFISCDGVTLDPTKTLEENGVHVGETLELCFVGGDFRF